MRYLALKHLISPLINPGVEQLERSSKQEEATRDQEESTHSLSGFPGRLLLIGDPRCK